MIQYIAYNPFFRTCFDVNIRQDSDTFLSEHQLQAIVGHYSRYRFSGRM